MRFIHFDASTWLERFDNGFNDENVARLADALGLAWSSAHPGATVMVGYGTRARAEEHAMLAGSVMAAYGLDVVLADIVTPLPAIAWSAAHDPACVGLVMMSAGGAPAGWGGVLVRGADGGPADAAFLREAERIVSGTAPKGRGEVRRADLSCRYVDALLSCVDADAIRRAAPLVVADAMYGSTRLLLARLLSAVGARVVALHDGTSHAATSTFRPEPVEPWVDECEQLVVSAGAQCGVAVSGAGGRGALIDERGRLVSPHNLTSLLLRHAFARGYARGGRRRVVTTTASSARVRRQGELLGLEVSVVPVGFDRVYGELGEGDVVFASEEYGGICIPAHLHERDGLLACLLALEMLARDGRPLSIVEAELEREIGHMVYGRRDIQLDSARIQTLRNILPGLNPADLLGKAPVSISHTDGLRLLFDDDSWVMLRPARTQAAVRAYAEAPSTQQRDELLGVAERIARGQL